MSLYLHSILEEDNALRVEGRVAAELRTSVVHAFRGLPGYIVIGSLAINILSLLLPLAITQVYDRIVPNEGRESLAILLLAAFLALALETMLRTARAWLVLWSATQAAWRTHDDAIGRVLGSPSAWISRDSPSRMIDRIRSLTAIAEWRSSPSRLVLLDLPFSLLFAGLFVLIGGLLALVPLAVVVVVGLGLARNGRRLQDATQQRSAEAVRIEDFLVETLKGVAPIKAAAMEPQMVRRRERLEEHAARWTFESTRLAEVFRGYADMIANACQAATLVAGAIAVMSGAMSVGALACCTMLTGRAVQPVLRCLGMWNELQGLAVNAEKGRPLLELPRQDRQIAGRLPNRSLSVSLDKVSVESQRDFRPGLKRASLVIEEGSVVAILGVEGPGSSALAALITGRVRPSEGRMLVGGLDPVVSTAALRGRVIVVSPTHKPFSGTLLENLTAFRSGPAIEAACAAARLIGLEEEIHKLPQGYKTRVGDSLANDLSEGFLVRMAIARAIALKPGLLILDEANTPLDVRCERLLANALPTIRMRSTIVVLTNRPSFAAAADRVFALSNGVFIPEGRGGPLTPVVERGPEMASLHHPVHEWTQRIREAFSDSRCGDAGRSTLAGLIPPLLDHLEWSGSTRAVAEALPHQADVEDFATLRLVLLRLGFMTDLLDLAPSRVQLQHVPCLVVCDEADRVELALSHKDGIGFVVLDTSGTSRIVSGLDASSGLVYRIRAVEPGLQENQLQRDGWIGPVLKSFAPQIRMLLGTSLFLNATGLLLALFLMAVYDFAIGPKAFDTLLMLAIGVTGLLVLDFKLRSVRAHGIAYLCARFDALVAVSTYSRVLSLPLAMTEQATLGAQLARFRQFVMGRSLFGSSVASALFDVPFSFVSIAFLFFLGGTLAFIPIALAVVLVGLALLIGSAIAEQTRSTSDLKLKSDALVVEIATKATTIRDTGAEDTFRERAGAAYRDYLKSRFRVQYLEASLQAWSYAIVIAAGAAVLGFGALRVMERELTIGALIAIMAVSWRVLMPLQTVAIGSFRLVQFYKTLRQIDFLMRLKPEQDRSHLGDPARRPLLGKLAASDVTFRYPQRQEFALRSVRFDVQPNEFVTITGPSGAGKSTLLKMLLGLYQPQAGALLIDGKDVRQFELDHLRQNIAYLSQDPVLFYGTVAQNVRLTAPEASDQEIWTALARVGLSASCSWLSEGLETRVSSWTGVQSAADLTQRLALAAVLARARPLLLLDAPHQHLNAEGDTLLLQELMRRKHRSTIVLVTQRPSYLKLSDKVIFMRDGAVVSCGRPEEMLPRIYSDAVLGAGSAIRPAESIRHDPSSVAVTGAEVA
jgi:ATP-binding cassette, subfamily C, bacterial LapB